MTTRRQNIPVVLRLPCRVAIACVLAFACACLVPVFVFGRAYAYFNDVTDSYPALQEIPISGDVLTGADIPEGMYSITATSSSYMCKFTNVTLTSVGGELWATFTISKAYNALFFGTAEEAAACTNEDGTDYSAYYVTEPLEGYVARQFSLPIPALNYEITIATFSGGNKGIDKGLWYTRTVVFNSSDDVMRAIDEANASQQTEDPGISGGNEPSEDDTNGSGAEAGNSSDELQDESSSDGGDDGDDEGSKSNTSSSTSKTTGSSGSSTSTNANSGSTANSGSVGSGGTGGSAKEDREDVESSKGSSAKNAAKTREGKFGHEISLATLDDLPLVGSTAQIVLTSQQSEEPDEEALIAIAFGIGVVNLVLIGVFLVMARRARPRRFPRV